MSYYKITNSQTRSLIEKVWGVQYSVEHWTRPQIGKLFVFDSFTNALRYCVSGMTGRVRFPIWKCEVKDPETLSIMSDFNPGHEKFWESFPTLIKDNCYVVDTPIGTIGVSAVRLLEQTC